MTKAAAAAIARLTAALARNDDAIARNDDYAARVAASNERLATAIIDYKARCGIA